MTTHAKNVAPAKRAKASNIPLMGPIPWVRRNPLSKYRIRVVQIGGVRSEGDGNAGIECRHFLGLEQAASHLTPVVVATR